MSNFAHGAQDWTQARAEGHTLALIIEQAPLTAEQRNALAEHEGNRWSLMWQPEVIHLCNEGPLLLDMTDRPFEHLAVIRNWLDANLIGWLSSPLPAHQLASHLGDALACLDANDALLLLRSYGAPALPPLHEQRKQPWHHWLFGPVDAWWSRTEQGWQRFAGLAQREIPEYHPIRLDAALMRGLQHDAQAEQLLQQVGKVAPESFASDCHGERLQQVQRLLAVARDQKLVQPDDQAFFVLYSLMAGTSLHERPGWSDILRRVNQDQTTLEQALAAQEGI
jgi:hypothetical protein